MRTFRLLNDQECAVRARNGDGAAFAELVTRYQARIYRFLTRLTRSQDDARDLTQDSFMHAFRALEQWRPEAPFSAWLFRIARNLAFDQLRRARLVDFVPLDDAARLIDPSRSPDAALAVTQQLSLLGAALARLPIEHREILLLREIEEMPYDEIAVVLNLTLGTVKSRIARARAALLGDMSLSLEAL